MLFASLLIDANEGRAVQNFDVMGAYLQASLPDDKALNTKFEGKFLDIMCEVNPEYEKLVTYEKGKKLLYVLILKAIYRMIESALLWYYLFATTLLDLGFKINRYEQCIANKVMDEKQCTIGWFVDDKKVSHMDENVNSMIALTRLKNKIESYIAQQKRSTRSLVWPSNLLSEIKYQCRRNITLMRL